MASRGVRTRCQLAAMLISLTRSDQNIRGQVVEYLMGSGAAEWRPNGKTVKYGESRMMENLADSSGH